MANRMEHEEERRLYYVAMTRARETLCVFQREDASNPHVRLIGEGHVLERKVSIPNEHMRQVGNHAYSLLGLKQLYIGYAGRYSEDSPIHNEIRSLSLRVTVFT